MPRSAFSVRFPADLVASLDRIAAHCGQSRSDLMETLIKAVDEDAEARDMVLQTTVVGAPTEKRNLRLAADSMTRLKRLAGDLEPSDFLRHMIAYVVATAPREWHHQSTTDANTSAGSVSARRGSRSSSGARLEDEADVEVAAVRSGVPGLAILVILLIGALVTLIVWLIRRSTDPSASEPGHDSRGQLPGGPQENNDA